MTIKDLKKHIEDLPDDLTIVLGDGKALIWGGSSLDKRESYLEISENKHRTFWYEDEDGGEFFVEAATRSEADKIATAYFADPVFIDEVDYATAEAMGLDTY